MLLGNGLNLLEGGSQDPSSDTKMLLDSPNLLSSSWCQVPICVKDANLQRKTRILKTVIRIVAGITATQNDVRGQLVTTSSRSSREDIKRALQTAIFHTTAMKFSAQSHQQ
jgi:hypothetical protein